RFELVSRFPVPAITPVNPTQSPPTTLRRPGAAWTSACDRSGAGRPVGKRGLPATAGRGPVDGWPAPALPATAARADPNEGRPRFTSRSALGIPPWASGRTTSALGH